MAVRAQCVSPGMWVHILASVVCLLSLSPHLSFTDPVENDCPCADPSHCEPITASPRTELFAFVVKNTNWKKYDWSKITTVAIFAEYDPELMCLAHSKGARIVVAVVYPAENLTNPAARSAWIAEQVAQAKQRHLDGINFDIEYPVTPEHAHFVVDLVNETAQAFRTYNPHAQITFDIGGFPVCKLLGRCYDNRALAQICDFLFGMFYDFGAAGPVSLPNSPMFVIELGIKLLQEDGVHADKLVIGVPWYGYDYPCVKLLPGNICLVNRTGAFSQYQIDYGQLMKLLPNSLTGRKFSQLAQSPYFLYKDASGITHQVWYDDPSSLSMRYSYGKSIGLAGVGMWNADSLDYSNEPQALNQTRAMWDAINSF